GGKVGREKGANREKVGRTGCCPRRAAARAAPRDRLAPQLPVVPMRLPTGWKVALALLPRGPVAARQTTMIRANMTAYSTAVGPSSFFRNSTTDSANLRMAVSPQKTNL